jgi:hypothetical protein
MGYIRGMMRQFPYITDYVNGVFSKEVESWDYVFLRPLMIVAYFFVRCVLFPLKFVFHRKPFGFEAYLIDWWMTFGIKYVARQDAAELFMRHVQIEPLLYQHILRQPESPVACNGEKLNTIDAGENGVAAKHARALALPGFNRGPVRVRTQDDYNARQGLFANEIRSLAGQLNVIDHLNACYNSDGQTINVLDNKAVYRDDDHLTKFGATQLAGPAMTDVFTSIAN